MQEITDESLLYWKCNYNISSNIIEYLESIASEKEIAKALEYSSPVYRNKFIFRNGILKILLSYIMGVDISLIDIRRTKYGKPFIKMQSDEHRTVKFNYSTSENYVLYAFSYMNDIGCDIIANESGKELPLAADNIFSDLDILRIRSNSDSKSEFCKIWTRKEAVVKCLGTGFSEPGLNGIDVSEDTIKYDSLDNSQKGYFCLFTSAEIENCTFSIAAKTDTHTALRVKELDFENSFSDKMNRYLLQK